MPFEDKSSRSERVPSIPVVALIELLPRAFDLRLMVERPLAQRLHRLPQTAAEVGQFVIDARRNGWKHGAGDEAAALQSAQRQVSAAIVDRLAKTTPGLDMIYRDLTTTPLDHLSGSHLAAAQGAEPADALAQDLAAGKTVLEDFWPPTS
jgi:hypothetical protein